MGRGWPIRSRIGKSSGRTLRQPVIPPWKMGIAVELVRVGRTAIMVATVSGPARSGRRSVPERPQVKATAWQLNRGGRPRRADSAARAMTRQRRMLTLPGPRPAEHLARTVHGPSLPPDSVPVAAGRPASPRCVTGAAGTMKQTGERRKLIVRRRGRCPGPRQEALPLGAPLRAQPLGPFCLAPEAVEGARPPGGFRGQRPGSSPALQAAATARTTTTGVGEQVTWTRLN